jgi:hypothetical protein
MGDIVSLEQDRVASLRAKGVGQQKTGKGAVLKTKKQLASEELELYKAGQEETRRKLMREWYDQSKVHTLNLYTILGFPAHADRDEKTEHIVGTLMGLAEQIIAQDPDTDAPEVWGKAFQKGIEEFLAANKLEVAKSRTVNEAAVVAGLIIDPALWGRLDGKPNLADVVTEPWLGVATVEGATREEREGAAFKALVDVKLHDVPAARYLRERLDEALEYTPEALLAGLARMVPPLMGLVAKERAVAAVPVEVPAPVAAEDARTA